MTQFPSLLAILFLALLSVVNAAPADPSTGPVETTLPSEVEGTEGHAGRPGRCRETRIRREWYIASDVYVSLRILTSSYSCRRALSIKQRLSYINAVKCLNTLPSANPSHGTVSRYDDFIWTHVQMTPGAHLVVSVILISFTSSGELTDSTSDLVLSRANSTHGTGTSSHCTTLHSEMSAATVAQLRTSPHEDYLVCLHQTIELTYPVM